MKRTREEVFDNECCREAEESSVNMASCHKALVHNIKKGNMDAVAVLIANVPCSILTMRDKFHRTPLHHAVQLTPGPLAAGVIRALVATRNEQTCRSISKALASANAAGLLPLHVCRSTAAVTELCTIVADVAVRDRFGRTLLHHCATAEARVHTGAPSHCVKDEIRIHDGSILVQ